MKLTVQDVQTLSNVLPRISLSTLFSIEGWWNREFTVKYAFFKSKSLTLDRTGYMHYTLVATKKFLQSRRMLQSFKYVDG